MGCVASKLDINDVHPNMFAVNNVDDLGVKLNSGQLEITEVELVLHRRGKQPVKWPLRYLKRYGFEEGLFSFEAGRKNPTGPGIYSFKCRRAENLFNLLQVRVRNQLPAQDTVRSQLENQEVVPGNSSPTGEEPSPPRRLPPGTLALARTSLASSLEPESPGPGGREGEGRPSLSSYINCGLPALTLPPRVPPLHPGEEEAPPEEEAGGTPGHAYENVGLQSPVAYLPPRDLSCLPPKPVFRASRLSSTRSDTSETDPPFGPRGSPPPSPTLPRLTCINYIVLDLDTAAPSAKLTSPTYKVDNAKATTTGTTAAGYVTIDFDKTDALIKSANQRFFEDDAPGVRKTRHNSSLSDLGVSAKLAHKVD